ncbi:hypothetical protein H072_112 [Dactylellina haptotyla CBS 200.50]|uniref:Peptidase S8/S53 domain-containing protein n=1 Tax=Dactylellina haptotyla (strain CBS 200.50) TaxID=1284197 RepID=S8CDL9_DACHA|nr:hypothetical protein H072_112 [Dactylellina haptotyla CBS 200.50]
MPIFSSMKVTQVILLLVVTPLTFAAPHQTGGLFKRAGATAEQKDATWHLARLTHNGPMGKGEIDYRIGQFVPKKGTYRYPASAGEGVDIYIVDSGVAMAVNRDKEFEASRLSFLSVFDGDKGEPDRDSRGQLQFHGTMVAGIAGSKSFGVAKKANIISVKRNYGVEAILENHKKRMKEPGFKGSVVNNSGGRNEKPEKYEGGDYKKLIDAGIHIVMSAGNRGEDACNHAPSGLNQFFPEIIAVGATDQEDKIWKQEGGPDGSNTGKCVDIYAPGEAMWSTNTLGREHSVGGETSGATPIVSGLIALELAADSKYKLDPKGMKAHILSIGFHDAVLDAQGKPVRGTVLAGNKPLVSGVGGQKSKAQDPPTKPENGEHTLSPSKFELGAQIPIPREPTDGNGSDGQLVKIKFLPKSIQMTKLDGSQSYLQAPGFITRFKDQKVKEDGGNNVYTVCGSDMPGNTPAGVKEECQKA